MNANNLRRYTPLLVHVLAWAILSFLLLMYFPLTWKVKLPNIFWGKQILSVVVMVVIFYLNAWLIVPKTLLKNKRLLFAACITAIICLVQVLFYVHNEALEFNIVMAKILGIEIFENPAIDDFVLALTLLVLGISTSYAMLQNWRQDTQRHQQLEQQQTMAELSLLKAQINPHFFFNTLNNIYSLTYINVEDSRKALHTLSRMMRYLLYSTEDEQTSLLKEIDFLRDYISLMRLRTDDKLRILISIPDNISDYKIAPMLLLPFVENAFKHGVDATQSSEIKLKITQEANHLELEVENDSFTNNKNRIEPGGIGLVNTKRRLELIYPGKHELSTGINNHGNYEVNLQLELEP